MHLYEVTAQSCVGSNIAEHQHSSQASASARHSINLKLLKRDLTQRFRQWWEWCMSHLKHLESEDVIAAGVASSQCRLLVYLLLKHSHGFLDILAADLLCRHNVQQ
jgi:hypothetical protein